MDYADNNHVCNWPVEDKDKTTTPFRKLATLVAVDYQKKSACRFRRTNISQSETALCSAVLAQSATDTTNVVHAKLDIVLRSVLLVARENL